MPRSNAYQLHIWRCFFFFLHCFKIATWWFTCGFFSFLFFEGRHPCVCFASCKVNQLANAGVAAGKRCEKLNERIRSTFFFIMVKRWCKTRCCHNVVSPQVIALFSFFTSVLQTHKHIYKWVCVEKLLWWANHSAGLSLSCTSFFPLLVLFSFFLRFVFFLKAFYSSFLSSFFLPFSWLFMYVSLALFFFPRLLPTSLSNVLLCFYYYNYSHLLPTPCSCILHLTRWRRTAKTDFDAIWVDHGHVLSTLILVW